MSTDRHARVERRCEYCGDLFTARIERVNKGQGRFCSLIHANLYAGDHPTQLRGFEKGKMYFSKTEGRWIVRWYDNDGGQHTTPYPKWWWTINVGDIPKGCVVVYIDRNPLNIESNNFDLSTRSQVSYEAGKKGLGVPKPSIAGENSKWWRGGVSQGGYPQTFTKPLKKRVKIRDGYACQCCYSSYSTEALDVHHIDRDISNNDLENLVTVCKGCHKGIHGKSSKMNDRIRYFQSLLP